MNDSSSEPTSSPKRTGSKNKFTPEEDEMLRQLVGVYGPQSWRTIALHMKTRTGRQCRERWINYLSPDVSKDPWRYEEEVQLTTLVSSLGKRWSLIANFFPDRTDVGLRNHWISMNKSKTASRIKRRKNKTEALDKSAGESRDMMKISVICAEWKSDERDRLTSQVNSTVEPLKN